MLLMFMFIARFTMASNPLKNALCEKEQKIVFVQYPETFFDVDYDMIIVNGRVQLLQNLRQL